MNAVRLRALGFAALLIVLLLAFARLASSHSSLPTPAVSDSIEVYFSRPIPGRPSSLRGGPDAALASAIDRADHSIDMAIYNLDLWSVRDALLRAADRGVDVRLVVEADNLGQPEILALIAAGIPVVADGWEPLMHDKFTVIDGGELWTGSMNYTVSDAYFNNNNLVRLRSPEAAAEYRHEFEEMFLDEAFGLFSPAGAGAALKLPDGTPIEVYFAPDDRPLGRLVELVASAEESVDLLAFSLTSDELTRALIERAEAGVRVRGVLDSDQAANLGSEWNALRQAGLDVHLDGSPDLMHHKVLILDGAVVVTGSYNFSRSAEEQNDENLVIVYDRGMAERYQEEFERVYVQAR
jgi:phosphatidylserine/phosphatidylglycerophosphate/cardiolipin synthase-like enzyme